MTPEQARANDARQWMQKAAQDLRRVRILLSAEPPDIEGALFHSQQAAEKSLKAFLTWHDVAFRRVHDLDEIGGQCLGVDPSLAEALADADELTKYAWRFRYPGAPYEPSLIEAQTAARVAEGLFQAVRSRLPEAVRQ